MADWIDTEAKLAATSFDAPWLMALDCFEGYTHLRITAGGKWEMLPGLSIQCGPDGRSDIPIASDALLLPSCRPGALIGKIGGSSASLDRPAAPGADPVAGEPAVFAIGSACIVALKDLPLGPLFVGINIEARPLAKDCVYLRYRVEL